MFVCVFLCVCRGCPRGGTYQKPPKPPKPPKQTKTTKTTPSTTFNSDGNQRKCRWGSQEMASASASASASATASACPRAQGAMGTLREPCRVVSHGNQRKMVRGQNHQKLLKTTKTIKTNKNHQHLVEMKGNGKGCPRGTVVDLMETTRKW